MTRVRRKRDRRAGPLALAGGAALAKSPGADAARPLAERLGNRAFAAWLAGAAGAEGDAGADAAMAPGALFGVPLADVAVQADAARAARANGLGARGYTDGESIGLGPTADASTLLHEAAHVVQHRGGNTATARPVQTRGAAELQAEHAVAALRRGGRPQLGAYRAAGLLLDKPKPQRKAPGHYTFTVPKIREWQAAGKGVLYQVYRVHLLNLYPGATEQDVVECLGTLRQLYYTGDLEKDLANAERKHKGRFKIGILPTLHDEIRRWLKAKGVDAPNLDANEAGSPDGRPAGTGAGETGEGTGAGAAGSGAGTVGVSAGPGQKVSAPNVDAAVAQVQKDIEAAKPKVTTTEADGREHIWPAELADPEQRKLVLQLMKDIVGEPLALPAEQQSEVPPRLTSDEAAFLLKIATSDAQTRAAIVSKLKGSGALTPPGGQTLAQTLDTAIANVELEKHAGELGVPIDKAKETDPSKIPIENRPVHGRIVNLSGALSPGERAVWRFHVDDDRDAFRVPHIYIAWAAFRSGKDGTERISSENTHQISVREQGLLNDGEFDFTVRETGDYVVKAIVRHNFFRPAYFEEAFVVEEEFAQSERQFKEGHGDIVATDRGWDAELYEHGGEFNYRLGRKRTGKLKGEVHATTNQELIDQLKQQKEEMRTRIDKVIEADPSRKEALNDAYDKRAHELDEQIAKIGAQGGTTPLVVRGQLVSRVREVEDATLTLACTLSEVTAPDGKSTWFKLFLHDATPRASRKVNHFESEPAVSVEAAQRDLFLQIAEAYPFGTVNVLFQGYDHVKHAPTQNFVQFQKRTDTLAKDIKAVVFDETVDTLVNVVGFVLTLFPPTTAVGITLLVAYNTSKAISENVDDWETGNFEKRKAGIALADLVINLLPLAPRIVKVGKVGYYVIKGASVGGTVLLMTAVGLDSVRELRAGKIDALTRKLREYEKLKRDNPAHPLIAKGTLLAEIEQLKAETADATKMVFTQLAAQAVFMHVVSTSVEAGLGAGGLKPGPVETRVLPEARSRKAAVGVLEETGRLRHVEGAVPRYDYGEGRIVADGNTVKPPELGRLLNEAAADRALTGAGVTAAERAKVGAEVAKAGVEVRRGPKTRLEVTAGERVLVVGDRATAADIRVALNEAKPPGVPQPKPQPKPEPRTFAPAERAPPGSAADRVAKLVNGQLSEAARAKLGPVEVQIVPEGGLGPGKTRAKVVRSDGKTIVVFEERPRPGTIAEEIAHLEQLADPKFESQAKLLAEVAGKDWSTLSDAKRLEAYKARLVLEADAQKRVIDQLLARPKAADPERFAIEVADVDAAFQNLEQLRHNLGETVGLIEQARAGALVERPGFIDEPPALTNKRTVNRRPLPEDWAKMNQNEFVKKYKETYPDTTLTDKELRDRHRNGMRLNPESGRLKDPTLVEDPVPDIAAVAENERTVSIDDLKLSKADKQRMKSLLDERDKARRARDRALADGDEERAAAKAREVNEASRQLGEEHARAFMEEHFPEFEQLYPSDPAKPSRAGDFDQVWVKYGKGKSGKKIVVQVIVVEAKGGSSRLGTRKTTDGLIVQQGTGAYFESIVKSMEAGTPEMYAVAEAIRSVKPGDVEYKLIRTPIEMSRGAKGRSTILAVEVADLNLAKTLKKP